MNDEQMRLRNAWYILNRAALQHDLLRFQKLTIERIEILQVNKPFSIPTYQFMSMVVVNTIILQFLSHTLIEQNDGIWWRLAVCSITTGIFVCISYLVFRYKRSNAEKRCEELKSKLTLDTEKYQAMINSDTYKEADQLITQQKYQLCDSIDIENAIKLIDTYVDMSAEEALMESFKMKFGISDLICKGDKT